MDSYRDRLTDVQITNESANDTQVRKELSPSRLREDCPPKNLSLGRPRSVNRNFSLQGNRVWLVTGRRHLRWNSGSDRGERALAALDHKSLITPCCPHRFHWAAIKVYYLTLDRRRKYESLCSTIGRYVFLTLKSFFERSIPAIIN